MNTIDFKSYAKLNLHLRITGREEHRYHLLQMLSIRISLFDQIQLSIGENVEKTQIFTNPTVPISLEKNLVYKAIKVYWKGKPPEVMVRIQKNIPIEAGLGGGSSNAASTLLALNKLYRMYTPQELSDISFQIGCDVPFFLENNECIVTGMGEKIQTSHYLDTLYHFVIVKPAIALSTQSVYQKWDQLLLPFSDPITFSHENVLSFHNDLLIPAKYLAPVLTPLLEDIQFTSPIGFSMTGSGSACFGCYASYEKAVKAMDSLSTHYPYVKIVSNFIDD
ncbi:4-(cytidine 5'-diphospho)-2-C-methyl-D-erythritol kinase [bacterium]|nr:4-(cytidine 5'-diphospho)-2-C-methyl-D-erythritol kinase [bacterium]